MKSKLIKIFIILLVFCSCEEVEKQEIMIDTTEDTSRFRFDDSIMKYVCIPRPGSCFIDTICVLSPTQNINMDTDILDFVQQMPEFPGGEEHQNAFININLHYPDSAIKNNIQGKVLVFFVVDKDGKLSQFEVGRKHYGYGLEEEALKIVKMMPNWNPGKQNGEKQNVRVVVPIVFKLKNAPKEEIKNEDDTIWVVE